MAWEKLGVIYNTDGSKTWMKSHPYLPTATQIDDLTIRIFLAFRDAENVGRLGFIDVLASDPRYVLRVSEVPALDIGMPGTFDDNGVSPLSVVRVGGQLRMYYAGWQLTPRARYLLLTGLAVSDDNGETFTRHQSTPILERSPEELLVRSGAAIINDEGLWKAWYAAGSTMVSTDGKDVPTYYLAYAESEDGIHWPRSGKPVLIPDYPDEYGFGRPHIEKRDGVYYMWASIRTHSKIYRIGYATSLDGLQWQRQDNDAGIDVSPSGWDSEMIGFASIIENKHGRFMFYNGNDYGKTGLGATRWKT